MMGLPVVEMLRLKLKHYCMQILLCFDIFLSFFDFTLFRIIVMGAVFLWDDTVDGIGKEVRSRLTPGLRDGPHG